jgi:hypothetical protein
MHSCQLDALTCTTAVTCTIGCTHFFLLLRNGDDNGVCSCHQHVVYIIMLFALDGCRGLLPAGLQALQGVTTVCTTVCQIVCHMVQWLPAQDMEIFRPWSVIGMLKRSSHVSSASPWGNRSGSGSHL